MRDEILENAEHKLSKLEGEVRELNAEIAELRAFVKRRREDNQAALSGKRGRRFETYHGTKKAEAIKILIAEAGGRINRHILADLMVSEGVPLGSVRQRANAMKSITQLTNASRLIAEGEDVMWANASASSASD